MVRTDQQTNSASSNHLLEAVVRAIPEPFFIYDQDGRYVEVLGGQDRSKYHDARALIGKTLYDIFEQRIAERFHAQITRAIETGTAITFEYTLNPADISEYDGKAGPVGDRWFEAHISPVLEGVRYETAGRHLAVWVAFDITDYKRAIETQRNQEQRLRQLAMTDSLSNLLNRRSFFDRAQHAIQRVREGSLPGLYICMLDLDHFKRINDSFGHAVGDIVIQGVAGILRENTREEDTAARVGGEEFALIIGSDDTTRVSRALERIREKIEETTFSIQEVRLGVTVSIGVSRFNTRETDIQVALTRADNALYKAKSLGRNRVEFS